MLSKDIYIKFKSLVNYSLQFQAIYNDVLITIGDFTSTNLLEIEMLRIRADRNIKSKSLFDFDQYSGENADPYLNEFFRKMIFDVYRQEDEMPADLRKLKEETRNG